MKNDTFPVSPGFLYKPVADLFQLFNAAELWLSFWSTHFRFRFQKMWLYDRLPAQNKNFDGEKKTFLIQNKDETYGGWKQQRKTIIFSEFLERISWYYCSLKGTVHPKITIILAVSGFMSANVTAQQRRTPLMFTSWSMMARVSSVTRSTFAPAFWYGLVAVVR